MLPSHQGRGQHGCSDQPSRQNFKSGHFSFSIGYRSQNILASALEMSGATSGLNEIFVHGRSPLREAAEDHKFRPALVTRHRRLNFIDGPGESFSTGLRNAAGCRHQHHADRQSVIAPPLREGNANA